MFQVRAAKLCPALPTRTRLPNSTAQSYLMDIWNTGNMSPKIDSVSSLRLRIQQLPQHTPLLCIIEGEDTGPLVLKNLALLPRGPEQVSETLMPMWPLQGLSWGNSVGILWSTASWHNAGVLLWGKRLRSFASTHPLKKGRPWKEGKGM